MSAAANGDIVEPLQITVAMDVKVVLAVAEILHLHLHLLPLLRRVVAIARMVNVAANGDIAEPLQISVAMDVKVAHVMEAAEIPLQAFLLPHLLPLLLLLPMADLLLPPGTVRYLIHQKDHAFQDLVEPSVLPLVVMELLR